MWFITIFIIYTCALYCLFWQDPWQLDMTADEAGQAEQNKSFIICYCSLKEEKLLGNSVPHSVQSSQSTVGRQLVSPHLSPQRSSQSLPVLVTFLVPVQLHSFSTACHCLALVLPSDCSEEFIKTVEKTSEIEVRGAEVAPLSNRHSPSETEPFDNQFSFTKVKY